jgi:acylaminoacyl-peptidase
MAKRSVEIEDLLRFKLVSDPQINQQGDLILFGMKQIKDQFKAVNHLFTVDREGKVIQLTQGEKSVGAGRWAPGGVSFVSSRNTPGSQLFLLPGVGEAKQLTHLDEGVIGDYKWSPDGNYVAFTFREAHPDFSEAGLKRQKEEGRSEAPLATNEIWYRLDGDGYFGEQRFKLHLLNVTSGEISLLSDRSSHGSYAFDWAPDSQRLVVAHSAEAEPFIADPNDQLYIVDLSGNQTQIPGLPKGEKEAPIWSPDGQWIAYSGDVDLNDPWGTRNRKLYVVSPEGGEPRDLTGHQDYDLEVATLSDTKEAAFGAVIKWAHDSKGIYAQVGTNGETQIGFVYLEKGGIELLTEGKCAYFMGNISPNGEIPVVYGDPLTVPEIALFSEGKVTRLTEFNKAWHDEVEVLAPEEIWLETPDNTKVHTWVIKPRNPNGSAVLEVHGGPHTQYGWVFFHEFQVLAAQGYTVVYSNPRGSKGYGESHCKAIQGDWGNKDWIDIQVVKDWMKQLPGIQKIGIMGGSYGGYMTNWAIGHTHEFTAAITDRCVSNMVSMAGNSDFPFNKDGYFKGVAWGSLEDIKELWRVSPIAYFQGVKTPTLVIHSEGDLRCNVEQGEQVFNALKMQGVDARFVRYPKSTSHGMSRSGPADLRIHRLNEIVEWWRKYL